MAGLRGVHCHRYSICVTQFPNQYDVRVLAHSRANAVGETRQMGPELSLDNLRLLARVNEFDRILEADDVEASCFVEVVNHRSKRRRLAGAGGAGDQHHALVEVTKRCHSLRQIQLGQFRNLVRDMPKHSADAGIFAEQVDSKATAVLTNLGKIKVLSGLEMLFLGVGQDFADVGLHFGVRQIAKLDG